jgi:hypothetical protein
VRGLAWLARGELVAYGTGGLAVRFVPGERSEDWVFPDREVTFRDASVDASNGTVTLVGERVLRRQGGGGMGTVGVVVQFSRGKLTLLSDVAPCGPLRGVTRLRSGEVVCCGDGGSIVLFDNGVARHVGSVCAGNLHAIAALPDGGAVTVGAGGHALSLSAKLRAQLEAVQTTRDLLSLTLDSSGVAWAGSAQARLLRRTRASWVRMTAELGLSSSVVALWAAPHAARAICDDGAVIEGNVTHGHIDR